MDCYGYEMLRDSREWGKVHHAEEEDLVDPSTIHVPDGLWLDLLLEIAMRICTPTPVSARVNC